MVENEELAKPAFSLEELDSGKAMPNPGRLKEVWGKWPGNESIEELLAALDGGSDERVSIDKE